MEEVGHSFYKKLYAAPTPLDLDLVDQVLNKVPVRVSAEMDEVICREVTLEKLHRVAKQLAKVKAPGINIEFYTHH